MTSSFTRLLHLGNVVVDVVLHVPALPEPGGDVFATGAQTAAGGGFNVMAAAARQGLAVAYGGVIGTGPFAALALTACAADGIEVLQPAKPGLDTGFVISVVDATGERTFLTSRGAEATLSPADLDPVRPAPGDAVYLSGYGLAHPSNAAALLGWLGRLADDRVVAVDPGPLAGALPDGVLRPVLDRADWVTCNAREGALLTGSAGTRRGRGHQRGRRHAHRRVPRGPGVGCRTGRGGTAGQRGGGAVRDPGWARDGADVCGTGRVPVRGLTGGARDYPSRARRRRAVTAGVATS